MTTDARRDPGDCLAFGFGSAVCMWGAAYVCHLPGLATPSALVFSLLVAIMLAAGVACGAFTARGWRGGLFAGLVAGALNLLVVGSVIGQARDGMLRAALAWIPGSLGLTALVMACGAVVGARLRTAARGARRPAFDNWPLAFAAVAALATLLLLSVGGVVTGYEAGLAVPDWPNTYGANMFLYPLARMTGGIYYEHAHRLFGALVGLTTLALAAYTQWVDRRGWAPILAWVAFLLVCCQGVLGGLRVTGRFTLSESAADLSPNLTLAMLHGVLAQVFFSTLCVLTLVQTRAWREWAAPLPRASAGLDFAAGLVTVAVLLLQLVFGAVLRHTASGLHLHLGFAGVAAVVAGGFGFRAWGRYEDVPILPRLGAALLALLGAQLLLGFAALGVTMMETGLAPAIQALVTTAHQTTGAALLACSVCATLWLRRAVAPVAGKQAPQGLERAV